MALPLYAALVLWLLGYPDQALAESQEALTLAQELSHPSAWRMPWTMLPCSIGSAGRCKAAQERAEAL